MPTFNSLITNYFVPLLPEKWRLPFIFRQYCAASVAEQELLHLEKIPTRFRVAVDIGANQGLYSYKMSQHFREVYAFEVNGDLLGNLRKCAVKNVHVIDQGLSSRAGETTLYIPVTESGFAITGWASLEREAVTQEFAHMEDKIRFAERKVQISTLDSFDLQEVDLIKIDVEGHEAEVLKGAWKTLERNRPHLLVETKGRLNEVEAILSKLRYRQMALQDHIGYPGLEEFYLYVPIPETPEMEG